MRDRLTLGAALASVAILSAAAVGVALSQGRETASAPSPAVLTPTQLLTEPLPAGTADPVTVERGRYLVKVGDCVSCHSRDGGEPMAGGLGLNTPFGVIYSPNLTSDKQTGIGGWTADAFYRAMHEGVGAHGERLYPGFPYPNFTQTSRADSDAILAYLKTVPAVRYSSPANRLPFPLNIRFMVRGWNLLFFRSHDFQPDASRSAQWNRGAYIVTALGHCGACHTPKNSLGADEKNRAFQGGVLDNWVAPNLTGDARVGLGGWSAADIVSYLKTGRNARAQAAGSMAEVVSYSTSLMSDADLNAIAAYFKAMPPSSDHATAQPDPGAMTRGGAIYSDACASCHLEQGVGQPGYFPPMRGDTMAQQTNPTGLIHLMLAGGRTAPTPTRLSPLSMPSFAWKLSDQETADVATFVRNTWGNLAPPVRAAQVASLRRKLGLKGDVLLTVNSGDHF